MNDSNLNSKETKDLAASFEKMYTAEAMISFLYEEKERFERLNKELQQTIYKYQRNTNLGFYIFLSTALSCLVYLLK
jgi:hypothetical protein